MRLAAKWAIAVVVLGGLSAAGLAAVGTNDSQLKELNRMTAEDQIKTFVQMHPGARMGWRERELHDSAFAAYVRGDYMRVFALLTRVNDSTAVAQDIDIIRMRVENGDASPRERHWAKLPLAALRDSVRALQKARLAALTPKS